MKKIAHIVLGFAIGAILTYYFCPREVTKMSALSTVMAPRDTISVAEAKLLSKNYQQNNPIEIDSLLEVEGSRKKMRSVSWSLDVVSDYLVYAKAKSDSLGYDMTGIRVYLGNYGKNSKPSKKNRNTLFIVPTGSKSISKASSINIGFQPGNGDIPAPPLNVGTGGAGDYNP